MKQNDESKNTKKKGKPNRALPIICGLIIIALYYAGMLGYAFLTKKDFWSAYVEISVVYSWLKYFMYFGILLSVLGVALLVYAMYTENDSNDSDEKKTK